MRVYFLKPATCVGFGYREDQVGDLPKEAAEMLIEKGFAVEVKEKPKKTVETRESKAAPEKRGKRKYS